METNYKNFFEEQLINEAFIYYNNDVKQLLRNIDDNISKELLKIEFQDNKSDMTFFSISDRPGYIGFVHFKNISKRLEDKLNSLNISKDIIQQIIQNVERGILQDNAISIINQVAYSDMTRNNIKIGRLINILFPNKFTAKQIEEFTNKLKSIGTVSNLIETVSGVDIKFWYNFSNYSSNKGTLGSSCMRHKECSHYFDIYIKNPEVCKLLILKDLDKIIGRALLWKLHDCEYEYMMDRIYSDNDVTTQHFKEYAKKHNYIYRRCGIESYSHFETPTGIKELKLQVKLKEWNFDYYPYMDTFKKLNTITGILYNNSDKQKNHILMVRTDGEYLTNTVYSSYYDSDIEADDAVYSDYLDTYIYSVESIIVNLGKYFNRGYYPEDHEDIVYDRFIGEYINIEDSYYSNFYNDYIYKEDLIDVVTKVYYSNSKHINITKHILSNRDRKILLNPIKLHSYEYLLNIGENHLVFYNDIIENNYFIDLKIKIYNTQVGKYSKVDCNILDIEFNVNDFYYTDTISYNYGLKDKENIIKRCKNKIKQIKNILGNKTPLLKFEDDDIYKMDLNDRLDLYNKRNIELIEWI